MQRMLERGGALGEVSKAMERYNAIQADRMRTFSIGLNRETRDTLTGLGTTRVQEAAAAMFPGIRTSETLRSASLLGGTRLTKDMQRMLERGGALGEVSKAMERYNAIQAGWMGIGSAGAQGDVVGSADEAASEADVDSELVDLALLGWLLRLTPSQVRWLGVCLLSLQQVGFQLEASGWVELSDPVNRSLSAALWLVTVLTAIAENSRER